MLKICGITPPQEVNMQTSHKAWVAGASTFIMVLLAMFGMGDMPAPETVVEAGATLGSALATAVVSWIATYKVANKPK